MDQSSHHEIMQFSIFWIEIVSDRNTEFSESSQNDPKTFPVAVRSQPERMAAKWFSRRGLWFIKIWDFQLESRFFHEIAFFLWGKSCVQDSASTLAFVRLNNDQKRLFEKDLIGFGICYFLKMRNYNCFFCAHVTMQLRFGPFSGNASLKK